MLVYFLNYLAVTNEERPLLNKNHRKAATLLGCGALFMWGIEPLLVSELDGMPIFQTLAIVFLSSFLVTALRLTFTRRWSLIIKQPFFIWVVGTLGICGSDFAYFLGAELAPIAHVDLIDYIWPCLVVVFTSLLPKETFKFRYILGGLLGLGGIYVLLTKGDGWDAIDVRYFYGYMLALYGAVLWGGYSAFSRYFESTPTEMVGIYCGVGSVICFILHATIETTVIPSASQAGLAILTGVTGAGLAYQLWDYGVKFGHVQLLGVVTYFVRIFAMVLLVSFGKEPFSWSLVMACSLVVIGVYVTSLDNKTVSRFKTWLMRKFYPSTNPQALDGLPS